MNIVRHVLPKDTKFFYEDGQGAKYYPPEITAKIDEEKVVDTAMAHYIHTHGSDEDAVVNITSREGGDSRVSVMVTQGPATLNLFTEPPVPVRRKPR